MAGETTITVIGNLTDDPELKFTPGGDAVANFRIASTPRTLDRQSGEWKDGEPLFLGGAVWRQPAENVAESLHKGDRVIVVGSLRQRTYETKEGEKRTVIELQVEEIGPSLRYATAIPQKVRSNDNGGNRSNGRSNGGGNSRQAQNTDDAWATATPARARAGSGGRGGNFDDEPPF